MVSPNVFDIRGVYMESTARAARSGYRSYDVNIWTGVVGMWRSQTGTASLGLAVLITAGFAAGCSDSPTGEQTTDGSLLITVTTLGQDPDRDYTVVIDDEDSYPISLAVLIEDVPVGEYIVLLDGIAENCAVTTDNPRSATVIRGFEIGVPFVVECQAAGGGKPGEPGEPEV